MKIEKVEHILSNEYIPSGQWYSFHHLMVWIHNRAIKGWRYRTLSRIAPQSKNIEKLESKAYSGAFLLGITNQQSNVYWYKKWCDCIPTWSAEMNNFTRGKKKGLNLIAKLWCREPV
jgi:hypothetical protein